MLMHTKGILVMTPDSAMVLTGKQSLDFSGGVSAEDNFGIGGYDRVMGPNGQAQYWAPNLPAACDVLMAHYDHTYVVPGETAPRRAATTDPVDRDVSGYPHAMAGSDFATRRRDLLRRAQPGPQEAVRHPHRDAGRCPTRTTRCSSAGPAWPTPTPRWCRTSHLGGWPVCLIGIESQPGAAARLPAHRRPGHLHRRHAVPALVEEDRPGDQCRLRQPAAGRAREPVRVRRLARVDAQAAAGVRRRDRPGDRQLRRPDRVLRDLPLPRRRVRGVLQGAQPEHDRAGAGGLVRVGARRRARRRPWCSPARSSNRTAADPRVPGLQARLAATSGAERAALRASSPSSRPRSAPRSSARSPRSSTGIHSIQRAVEVGSVDAIISVARAAPRDHRRHRARPHRLTAVA